MASASQETQQVPQRLINGIEIEKLTQPQPIAALAYWRSKCAGRPMPEPKDIDPTEIPRLLPYISMVDVLDETPPDYLFSIDGEIYRQVLGFGKTGRRFSEFGNLYGPAYERALQRFAEICRLKQPLAQLSELTGLKRGFYTVEVISLPLSRDGETVHRIFHAMGIVKSPAF